jgi:UMF1 family MFS transporter
VNQRQADESGYPIAGAVAAAQWPAPAVPVPRSAAEQRGWYWYEWANSAFVTTVIAVFGGRYLTGLANAAADASGFVHPFGIPVRAGSLFPYLISLAAGFQVLLMPIIGAIADRTGKRRRLLAATAFVGAAATVGFGLVSRSAYMLGGFFFLVASVAYACSIVVYNAFLPDIASPEERNRVSTRGWGFGYLGGGLLLVANLVLYRFAEAGRLPFTADTAAHVSIVSAGLWWATFTVIPLTALRDRPPPGAVGRDGQPHPASSGARAESRTKARPADQTLTTGEALTADHALTAGQTLTADHALTSARTLTGIHTLTPGQTLTAGFRRFAATFRMLRRAPMTLLFLAAFLLYNAGIQTVINQAALFADEELRLLDSTIIVAVLLVQFVAMAGAWLLGLLAVVFGAKQVVLASLVIWIGVLAYAFFLPAAEPGQFFALAALIGLVLGGSQALSRSLFSHLPPDGREAEYFSLYEITGRGTSWLGSALFGLAYQFTGSYRVSIISLVAFTVLGFVLLARTDIQAAAAEAGNEAPVRV